jgi:hypothetical protein
LYNKFLSENEDKISFSFWDEKYFKVTHEDPNFVSELYISIGGLISDILYSNLLITNKLKILRNGNSVTNLNMVLPDPRVVKYLAPIARYVLPLKLPMIVKPKPYDKDKTLGGYLLNDVSNVTDFIIKKHNVLSHS